MYFCFPTLTLMCLGESGTKTPMRNLAKRMRCSKRMKKERITTTSEIPRVSKTLPENPIRRPLVITAITPITSRKVYLIIKKILKLKISF